MFFEKGRPTTDVWYYEHPYPEGFKSYSKTKPMRVGEFDVEKAWWNDRTEGPRAWRVSAATIRERGFNLDIGNPTSLETDHESLSDLLERLAEERSVLDGLRATLQDALESAISG